MDDITNTVLKLVRVHAKAKDIVDLKGSDTELSAVGIDSLTIVRLMLELEKTYSIEFPADMIRAESFFSVRTLAELMQSLLAHAEN